MRIPLRSLWRTSATIGSCFQLKSRWTETGSGSERRPLGFRPALLESTGWHLQTSSIGCAARRTALECSAPGLLRLLAGAGTYCQDPDTELSGSIAAGQSGGIPAAWAYCVSNFRFEAGALNFRGPTTADAYRPPFRLTPSIHSFHSLPEGCCPKEASNSDLDPKHLQQET